MKQVKFFFVALMTMLMSVSLTSCFDNDENTQVDNHPIIGKVKECFMNLTFVSLDGYTIQSKNTVTTILSPNDYIIAACSYDREQDVDFTKNTIKATVNSVEKISGNMVYNITKEEDKNEDSSYKSNRSVICISDYYMKPAMIDNDHLLVPIQYFAHEKISQHTFSIVYYTDESEMKDKTELTIYLRHKSSETDEKETKKAFSYRIFDIRSAINRFNALNNRYPEKISIVSEVNEMNNDLPKETSTTNIIYKHK